MTSTMPDLQTNMRYCINPKCSQRQNPNHLLNCEACGNSLLINERYLLIKPLRELREVYHTEIFEVEDWDFEAADGGAKVLKVLKSHNPEWSRLFEREAGVLRFLSLKHCPGIPQVASDGYFTYSPSNSLKKLRCLVMEKIEGQDLTQWLEENGPLLQAQALTWLKQLIEILAQVHQQGLLHRDIKPSNIMLRPDGQLVLIDFGVVGVGEQGITGVGTFAYSAPEQIVGKAVVQSDFFALGRTFIHLLTGISPTELPPQPNTDRLMWRDRAPQISAPLADLIDDMLDPVPQRRPANTQVVWQRLVNTDNTSAEATTATYAAEMEREDGTGGSNSLTQNSPQGGIPKGHTAAKLKTQNSPISPLTSHRFYTVLLTSVVVTSLLMGLRWLGVVQSWELQAFDQLVRLRPEERPDPRLLVITITEKDIQSQNPQERRGSLSDSQLARLLTKLQQYQPRAIGLDIYRDFPVERGQKNLAERMRQSDRLITVCKISDLKVNEPGIPPPPEIPIDRVGFSDFISDPDGIVRRHLLMLTPDPSSPCTTPYAFSVQLAFRYLAAAGIMPKFTSDGFLQLGEVVFKPLEAHTGGYQRVDTWGHQILLNYRSPHSPQNIAAQVTLADVLNDRLDPNSVKDRIISIGAVANSVRDDWLVPYSQDGSDQQLSGVLMQTQMVSQILSAVLDRRPLSVGVAAVGRSFVGLGLVTGRRNMAIRRSPLRRGSAIIAVLNSVCMAAALPS